MAWLAEPKDLGVREDAEAQLGYREAFRERDACDHEGAAGRHVLDALVRDSRHVSVGEKLRQTRRLRRRDHGDAIGRQRRKPVDELIQPAGVAGRSTPAEPDGVAAGPHPHDAVFARKAFDLRPRDVRGRKDRDWQALRRELIAALLGLCLQRVVREVQFDGVLEEDRGAVTEVVEERPGCTECRRERVRAGRVAALTESGAAPRIGREDWALVVRAREAVPAGAGESRRDRRRVLERELPCWEYDDLIERRLRPLRHRVERAESLDLVAEQLDARRLLGRRRVDIDDPAAARERARLAHFSHRLVAEVKEPRRGLLPAQALARAERSSAARELVRRDRVLEERPQAGDDCDRGLSRREPPERQEALVHRGPRRGGGFERHRLALRKREDPLLAEPAASSARQRRTRSSLGATSATTRA